MPLRAALVRGVVDAHDSARRARWRAIARRAARAGAGGARAPALREAARAYETAAGLELPGLALIASARRRFTTG